MKLLLYLLNSIERIIMKRTLLRRFNCFPGIEKAHLRIVGFQQSSEAALYRSATGSALRGSHLTKRAIKFTSFNSLEQKGEIYIHSLTFPFIFQFFAKILQKFSHGPAVSGTVESRLFSLQESLLKIRH